MSRLVEELLREMHLMEMSIPYELGKDHIRRLVTSDHKDNSDRIRQIAERILSMDIGSDRRIPNFLDEDGNIVDFKEWLRSISDDIIQEKKKMYSNDLERSMEYIRGIFEEIYGRIGPTC